MLVHLLAWHDERVVGDFDFFELREAMNLDAKMIRKQNTQFKLTANRKPSGTNLPFFGDDRTLSLRAV
jgi:hypothetical protein